MAASAEAFSLGWDQFAAGVAAVGALGAAAFGLTEALGKALAYRSPGGAVHLGLPYAGFGAVKRAMRPLAPALRLAYGAEHLDIVAQQYRADRSKGAAPDTIRQGVRLALPFMEVSQAADVIACVWDMKRAHSEALAEALQAPSGATAGKTAPISSPAGPIDPAQALAGRFATALDARINAAFDLAEERYEAQAKMWAGVVAVLLALVMNYGLGPSTTPHHRLLGILEHGRFEWSLAFAVGLAAVPLAPVAKDISTRLQDALTAFKAIPVKLG